MRGAWRRKLGGCVRKGNRRRARVRGNLQYGVRSGGRVTEKVERNRKERFEGEGEKRDEGRRDVTGFAPRKLINYCPE